MVTSCNSVQAEIRSLWISSGSSVDLRFVILGSNLPNEAEIVARRSIRSTVILTVSFTLGGGVCTGSGACC